MMVLAPPTQIHGSLWHCNTIQALFFPWVKCIDTCAHNSRSCRRGVKGLHWCGWCELCTSDDLRKQINSHWSSAIFNRCLSGFVTSWSEPPLSWKWACKKTAEVGLPRSRNCRWVRALLGFIYAWRLSNFLNQWRSDGLIVQPLFIICSHLMYLWWKFCVSEKFQSTVINYLGYRVNTLVRSQS